MALVSQFGATMLAAQDALSRSVVIKERESIVANLLIISLDREEFLRDQESLGQRAINLFRNQLQEEIERFCNNNGWSFHHPLSIHILLCPFDEQCVVRAEHQEIFYSLSIRDDKGTRNVSVEHPKIVLGRFHSEPSRRFVSIYDASRSFSREHLVLTFQDMRVEGQLLGQNTTYLNEELIETEAGFRLVPGDVIRCGPHSFELIEIVH